MGPIAAEEMPLMQEPQSVPSGWWDGNQPHHYWSFATSDLYNRKA